MIQNLNKSLKYHLQKCSTKSQTVDRLFAKKSSRKEDSQLMSPLSSKAVGGLVSKAWFFPPRLL